MGSANYYLKARFPVDVDKEKLYAFFVEGEKAYNYWQNNREQPKETVVFWKEFTTQFPIVSKLISDLVGGDKDNSLAGELSIIAPNHCNEYGWVNKNTSEVLFYCAETWHFASWDRLCTFLCTEFHATSANWLSDEYVNLWDLLD